jgi:hypothetical protein
MDVDIIGHFMNIHQRKSLQLKAKSKTLLVEKYDKAATVKQHVNKPCIANMISHRLFSDATDYITFTIPSVLDSSSRGAPSRRCQ